MRNLNTIILVFAAVLYLTVCEAKCRGKNAVKLKRSLRLAVLSDDINNRHKSGLRKIFRRKRDTEDKEAIENNNFRAEIKILQKWYPGMSTKDGSAYRLFQGNVLDAILEQLNADRRFIKSDVTELKKAPDGIIAKVDFHFKKSELNPISHIRFLVSRGHLSSLKVDKRYFKILKTSANYPADHDKDKISNRHHQSPKVKNISPDNPSITKQEPTQNPEKQQAQSESSSVAVSSQTETKPENQQSQYQTQNKPTEHLNQPHNEATSQAQTQSQASTQNQANYWENQDQSTLGNAKQPEQAQDLARVATQQQQRIQVQNQNQAQNPIQSNENTQVTESQYHASPTRAPYQTDVPTEQQAYTLQQNVASYQQATQSNDKLTQTTPNPSTNVNSAQAQYNSQWNDKQLNQPNPNPAENAQTAQASNDQQNQKNEQSASLAKNDNEENISVKMNQAWFPFLSNHESPQYKMLAGNLEKGLKSVMDDDKNIKDVKVKDLLQADEGHTTVEFLLKFDGRKEASTEKLRKIVKTGDIAGISVDSSYFKVD